MKNAFRKSAFLEGKSLIHIDFSGAEFKSSGTFDLEQLYKRYFYADFHDFYFFGSLIWPYYLLSIFVLFGPGAPQAANFAQTL